MSLSTNNVASAARYICTASRNRGVKPGGQSLVANALTSYDSCKSRYLCSVMNFNLRWQTELMLMGRTPISLRISHGVSSWWPQWRVATPQPYLSVLHRHPSEWSKTRHHLVGLRTRYLSDLSQKNESPDSDPFHSHQHYPPTNDP